MLISVRIELQCKMQQRRWLFFNLCTREENQQRTATAHCDHLIVAQSGSEEDLERAIDENKEVYDFLESIS